MGKVVAEFSMSLDGFIAGPQDNAQHGLGLRGGEQLHDWLFNGTTPNKYNDFFKPAGRNREVVDEMMETTGAMIVGRRLYDLTGGWKGSHPINGLPIFLLTHHAPDQVPSGKSPITVVTDGVQSAVQQAKIAAGAKNVGVGGAETARQVLQAGLLDEIYIHLVPMVLGDGVSLFGGLYSEQFNLESISSLEGPGVSHLRYRVHSIT